MIKKTFKELNKFTQVFKELIEADENFINTKLGYACKRFEELNLTKYYKEYNEALLDVRLDHALVDKITDAVLRDESKTGRGFQYNKEGFKAVIKAEKEVEKKWEDKECEVEPFICKPENVPFDLSEDHKEVLTGLVI